MEMLRQAILQALEDKYNAQISAADPNSRLRQARRRWKC